MSLVPAKCGESVNYMINKMILEFIKKRNVLHNELFGTEYETEFSEKYVTLYHPPPNSIEFKYRISVAPSTKFNHMLIGNYLEQAFNKSGDLYKYVSRISKMEDIYNLIVDDEEEELKLRELVKELIKCDNGWVSNVCRDDINVDDFITVLTFIAFMYSELYPVGKKATAQPDIHSIIHKMRMLAKKLKRYDDYKTTIVDLFELSRKKITGAEWDKHTHESNKKDTKKPTNRKKSTEATTKKSNGKSKSTTEKTNSKPKPTTEKSKVSPSKRKTEEEPEEEEEYESESNESKEGESEDEDGF